MNEKVGRYQILEKLGRGAMGVVYLADDPTLNRRVAIKTVELNADQPDRRAFLHERLVRDGRAAAGLTHPHIVAVYDVLEEGDCGYLVMEYVPGESLATLLARTPHPDVSFALKILREMAAALDYTHGRGIIHRDIKPANVMIDTAGSAKIMDFGIARITDTRTNTPTGMVMGTLEYMAPEQVKGEPVDGRADQFSLAAVAYEMLTGTTLYGQQSFATLAYKLVNEMPPSMRIHNPALSLGVDEVVNRALRKLPSERFPTCGAFVGALERAFSGELPVTAQQTQAIVLPAQAETVDMSPPTVQTRPAAQQEAQAPRRQRRRLVIALVSTLALVELGAVLFSWKPWASSPTHVAAIPAAPQPSTQTPADPRPSPVNLPPESTKPAETVAATSAAVSSAPKQAASVPAPEPPAAAPADASDASDTSDPSDAGAPKPARAALLEGEKLVAANQYPAAIQAFTKAIGLRPDFFIRAYFARGNAYLHQDRSAEAFSDYNEILRHAPRNAVALAQRGICHSRLKDDEAALEDFNRALQIRPALVAALNGRGTVYLHRKQYAKAMQDFNEAIRISPRLPLAYINRGNTEAAMGDESAAKADLKKGQELNSGKGQ